jgi:FkbM family methyltransferase
MKHLIKSIKSMAHRAGIDIIRAKDSPRLSYLGLRGRDFPVIFDIGANTGTYAANLARMFPKAKIYCFEPAPTIFRKLEIWASDEAQVTAVNLALSNHSGDVDMHFHEDHPPSSSLLQTTDLNIATFPFMQRQSSIKIRTERLDQFVKDQGIEFSSGALMKIDVQGHELAVLEGARSTLANVDAAIIEVNIDILYRDQCSFEQIIYALNNTGLRYAGNLDQSYGNDGHVMWIDAVFVRSR